ncbi:hypothetical protein AVEN_237970-1 [Araneus ventricosus]|uniref:Uncharacterized protein n=1 Tax=Araneus ventricosus TaxID=182803 RepID=A0A4Y2G290_ARAVE|nr:hypothetical protein AVEN_237970-1 [Araneus ventricosus]
MASSELARRLYPVKEQFISEEDLKETERLLRNLKCFQPNAASHIKAWVEQRQKSIEAIGCLEETLENLHRACNAAHGFGAAMEAVGGLAMVAGAILTKCGHESVGEFLTKKVSPVTTATGIATTMSSSVAETGLTHMTMKEIQMVLKKDEEYTRVLMENFEHSKKIDLNLRRIFNYSILSDNFLDVVRLVQEGISLVEVGYGAYSELIDELKCKASKGSHTHDPFSHSFKYRSVELLVEGVTSRHKLFLGDSLAIKKETQHAFDRRLAHPCSFGLGEFGVLDSFLP